MLRTVSSQMAAELFRKQYAPQVELISIKKLPGRFRFVGVIRDDDERFFPAPFTVNRTTRKVEPDLVLVMQSYPSVQDAVLAVGGAI